MAFLKEARNIALVVKPVSPPPVLLGLLLRPTVASGRVIPSRANYADNGAKEEISGGRGGRRGRNNERMFEDKEDHPELPCTVEQALNLYDLMVRDKVYRPINVNTAQLSWEDREKHHYCALHNKVNHPTKVCFSLKRLINHRVKNGDIELPQTNMNDNPLPPHGAHMASAFDEKAERLMAGKWFEQSDSKESLEDDCEESLEEFTFELAQLHLGGKNEESDEPAKKAYDPIEGLSRQLGACSVEEVNAAIAYDEVAYRDVEEV